MRYIVSLQAILAFFLLSNSILADEVITFFVRPYPYGNAGVGPRAFACNLNQAGKIAEYCLQGGMRTTIVAGIFFSYAGFLDITSINGQVSFPRKEAQRTAQLTFLVTDKITPIPIKNHIISHWELEPGTPAELYTIERKWDKDARLFYWETSQAELPDNRIIPQSTIIMFAKPKHVYVPIGASVAQFEPNLVLPDIFVREAIKSPTNALSLLELRQFFGPIGIIQQQKGLHQAFHLYDWGHETR